MDLSFKEYGAGHPFVILHGLFGMGDNWSTLGRRFGDHFLTFTPDMRNHGRSPHLPEMDYPSMSRDIHAFVEENWLYNAFLMGHSMGGKIAMQAALDNNDLFEKLIVVDIAPRAYNGGHDDIFKAMMSLDLSTMADRKAIQAELQEKIQDKGIVQFILKNIVFDKTLGHYTWRMNLDSIHDNYASILQGIKSPHTYDRPALFIRGANSGYVNDGDMTDIKKLFPQARLETIADAGHWVHAEQPQKLYDLVIDFLNE